MSRPSKAAGENLTQANKLSRSYAALVEALDRHRGKGQQYVKVEHVHVHQGGEAIVGALTQRGRGAKKQRDLMQREDLHMNQSLRCGARTRSGSSCRSPTVRGKRRCRMHGGAAGSGAPIGNTNALRHGHYIAEAIARRRGLAELIRRSRSTLAELDKRG